MTNSTELDGALFIRAPQSMIESLQVIAHERRVKVSVVVRWALEAYIKAFF
jgi:hypothetical protein